MTPTTPTAAPGVSDLIPRGVLTLAIHRLRCVANGNAKPDLANVAADDLQAALLASAAGGEPEAYMSSKSGHTVTKAQRQGMQNNGEFNIPLYTAPPVSQQSEAGNWQQYAKDGETAQEVIERERKDCAGVLTLLAKEREKTSQQSEHGGQVAAPEKTTITDVLAFLMTDPEFYQHGTYQRSAAPGESESGVVIAVDPWILKLIRAVEARAALTQAEATPAPVVQPMGVARAKKLAAEVQLVLEAANSPNMRKQWSNGSYVGDHADYIESELLPNVLDFLNLLSACAPTPAVLKPAEAVQAEGVVIPFHLLERELPELVEFSSSYGGQWSSDWCVTLMDSGRAEVCRLTVSQSKKDAIEAGEFSRYRLWEQPGGRYTVMAWAYKKDVEKALLATPPEQTGGGK